MRGPAQRAAQAAADIRELVLGGQLAPGERVAEVRLAEQLGVSRTPLRLALERLEHEGLLSAGDSGGFVVREFTLADARDAIELRGMLEGDLARRAAERRPSVRELEPLHGTVAQLERLVDTRRPGDPGFDSYQELNDRFHATVAELGASPLVSEALGRVLRHPFAAPGAFVGLQAELPGAEGTLFVAQAQYRTILEAIVAGQGSRAETVAREHARLALGRLELARATAGGLARVPGGRLIRVA